MQLSFEDEEEADFEEEGPKVSRGFCNPLGAEREQEDEWEEQRSEEHGDRVYWVNKRTGQSRWDRPGEEPDWM